MERTVPNNTIALNFLFKPVLAGYEVMHTNAAEPMTSLPTAALVWREKKKKYCYNCRNIASPRTPWNTVQVVHVILKVLNGPLARGPQGLAGVSCVVPLVPTPTEDGPEVSIHFVRLVLQEFIGVIRRGEAEFVVVQSAAVGMRALS